MTSKSKLDPWRVLCARLFELSSHDIPYIIERTGLVVDWSLNKRQDFSHDSRKSAYRPRINAAYDLLGEDDRLRVVNITATALLERGKCDEMNSDFQKIGWRMDGSRLMPATAEVSELFFPVGTQHDAYLAIREILEKTTGSLTIIDPYVDSSLFTMLKTIPSPSIEVKLLTSKMPPDFIHEAGIFLSQHTNMR